MNPTLVTFARLQHWDHDLHSDTRRLGLSRTAAPTSCVSQQSQQLMHMAHRCFDIPERALRGLG